MRPALEEKERQYRTIYDVILRMPRASAYEPEEFYSRYCKDNNVVYHAIMDGFADLWITSSKKLDILGDPHVIRNSTVPETLIRHLFEDRQVCISHLDEE